LRDIPELHAVPMHMFKLQEQHDIYMTETSLN